MGNVRCNAGRTAGHDRAEWGEDGRQPGDSGDHGRRARQQRRRAGTVLHSGGPHGGNPVPEHSRLRAEAVSGREEPHIPRERSIFYRGCRRASVIPENRICGQGVIRMQDILQREPKTSPDPSQREGFIARSIEQQTSKLPSDTFLWAALGSISASLILAIAGDQKRANFVGQWAPTFLILAFYNKMVKLHGSDNA